MSLSAIIPFPLPGRSITSKAGDGLPCWRVLENQDVYLTEHNHASKGSTKVRSRRLDLEGFCRYVLQCVKLIDQDRCVDERDGRRSRFVSFLVQVVPLLAIVCYCLPST